MALLCQVAVRLVPPRGRGAIKLGNSTPSPTVYRRNIIKFDFVLSSVPYSTSLVCCIHLSIISCRSPDPWGAHIVALSTGTTTRLLCRPHLRRLRMDGIKSSRSVVLTTPTLQ